ncbi:MAG: penicillin-binding protein 1C [Gammaproteobacteria bacterium]
MIKSRRRAFWFALVTMLVAWLCVPKPGLYDHVGFSSLVTDRHGALLRLSLAPDERYRLAPATEPIAPAAIDATLLYEDRYFYAHPGVNPVALARAAWSTYVTGARPVGASTVTMQLARLRFDLQTTTIRGKLVQIARALQLERHYSKAQILDAYFSLAPYGGNVEGIGTAARIYFGKSAADLTLPEALALAVIPQNPVRRDPSNDAGYARMSRARGRLIKRWIDRNPSSSSAAARMALPVAVRATRDLPFAAPQFALEQLRNAKAGATVVSTLDLPLQRRVSQQVKRYTQRHASRGLHNASVLLLDHRSMEVMASVGSADFFDAALHGQVDGTRAKRSPGSTLKPFLYARAMDQGLIHPSSLLKDAPARFAAFAPENFDRGFLGPVTATEALIYSRNVPAIDLLAKSGHVGFRDFLDGAGVAGLRDADHYGLSMILGGAELTSYELVRLYAMLANGGRDRPVVSVRDDAKRSVGQALLSPEAGFLTLSMLRRNPRPDELALERAGRSLPVAWKTGTSYGFRDAWSVGVIGPYVLAVWVGNFDGSSNPALVGRSAAAPLFFELIDALEPSIDASWRSADPGPALNVRRVDMCASTGDLPGRYCPQTRQGWFIPGVSPITVSRVHRAVPIDNASGLRACVRDAATTHDEVYEFWPSDLQRLFEQAGVAPRQPPRYVPGCALNVQATAGLPPTITSPVAHLTYQRRSATRSDDRLALQATTDSDAQWLFWFANDRFVGKVARDEALLWQPPVGAHRISVVDDLGRSHARQLTVALAR